MSQSYSVYSLIDVSYSKEVVENILVKGQALGFVYEDNFLKLKIGIAPLNLTEAVNFTVSSELPSIFVDYQDTNFSLLIYDGKPNTSIMFLSFGEGWKKKYVNQSDEGYEMHRYAKLMLDLIEDFKIIEFKLDFY